MFAKSRKQKHMMIHCLAPPFNFSNLVTRPSWGFISSKCNKKIRRIPDVITANFLHSLMCFLIIIHNATCSKVQDVDCSCSRSRTMQVVLYNFIHMIRTCFFLGSLDYNKIQVIVTFKNSILAQRMKG